MGDDGRLGEAERNRFDEVESLVWTYPGFGVENFAKADGI
jgi:hypothetical protein